LTTTKPIGGGHNHKQTGKIRHQKGNKTFETVGKAPVPRGVLREAIKADLDISADMVYALFEKVWETEELSSAWKQGRLTMLPKKGDLQVYKTWCGTVLLS